MSAVHGVMWMDFPAFCDQVVVRQGDEDACGKPAVAVAKYQEEGSQDWLQYSVCKHHARGRVMVPLSEIITMVRLDERNRRS